MSAFKGPNIITDGLVLALDGANIRSFNGPPQTNVLTGINYSFENTDTTNFKVTNGTLVVNIPSRGIRTVKYVDIYNNQPGATCCPNLFNFGDISVSGNTQYTYSIVYKTNTGYTHPNYMYRYEFNGGSYITEGGVHSTNNRTELGNGWYHAWGTFTTQASTNRLITYLFHYEYGTFNRVYVDSIQITQGSYIGVPQHMLKPAQVRGTTAETGGGWVNLNRKNLSEVDSLVVAGGGGGGMDMGGGGGGGGVIYSPAQTITPGVSITVTVGNGGSGAPAAGTGGQPGGHQYTIPATQGGNSIFGEITAIGGGFGGSSYRGYTPGIAGGAGGSGGGASGYNDNAGTFSGGAGTAGQGNRGGNSTAAYYSGGGGGAGGAGADSTNQPNGGIGVENSILGVSYYWGGGGGGASYSLSTGGNGGNGGGGGGAVGSTTGGSGLNAGSAGGGGGPYQYANTPGGNGGANTGGGGGGGSHYNANNKGGNGGSGIVIVRYRGRQKATGGTITSVGGYTIHTFTSSGTFIPDTSANTHGELLNGPTFNSDNGGSIVFDGANDFVELNTNNIITGTNPFSFECWYTITAVNGGGQVFGNYGSGYTSNYLWISGEYGIYINSDVYFPGYPLTSGTIHMVATRASNGATVLYRDGVQVNSGTLNGSIPAVPNFRIGADTTSAGGVGGERLNGKIYIQRVYNRVLSAAEVQQNYNATRARFGV